MDESPSSHPIFHMFLEIIKKQKKVWLVAPALLWFYPETIMSMLPLEQAYDDKTISVLSPGGQCSVI